MKIFNLLEKLKIRLMTNEQYICYLRKKGVRIGVGCNISKDANFGSEPWLVSIGDHVRVTKGVDFITHDGGIWTLRRIGLISNEEVLYGSIRIDDNCNISWNTVIMPNVHIGRNCITAAGAIVTKNMPDATIWGGCPAKQIETIYDYYEKVKDRTVPTYFMGEKDKLAYLKSNRPELWGGKENQYLQI